MSGLYAQFVETEVLPLVEKQYNVRLTKDPDARATMGCSSGGSAALAMAWYRNDLYHRVLTYSGTYVNQQWPYNPETPGGAWEFHRSLIPKSPVKPIRLWMHVSDRDNFSESDGMHDWVLANQLMAKVLRREGLQVSVRLRAERRALRSRGEAADAAAGARMAVEGLSRRRGEGRAVAPGRPIRGTIRRMSSETAPAAGQAHGPFGAGRVRRAPGAGHGGAGILGRAALLSDLRHAVGLAARVRPLARGDRLLQPGHAGLDLQVPLGAVRRPRAGARAHRLARPSPFVDARVPGAHHAGTLARGGFRSLPQPRHDRGLCGARRLLVGHAGHRHRRLAHRSGRDDQAGRDGGGVSMGLPGGDHRGGRRAAAARRGLRLEFLLCRDGGVDDRRRRWRCWRRRARSATPSVRSRLETFNPPRHARRSNGSPASRSSRPARSSWAQASPPMRACSRACSAPRAPTARARRCCRPGRRPRACGCISPPWRWGSA